MFHVYVKNVVAGSEGANAENRKWFSFYKANANILNWH